jgi:hypothetical protein
MIVVKDEVKWTVGVYQRIVNINQTNHKKGKTKEKKHWWLLKVFKNKCIQLSISNV